MQIRTAAAVALGALIALCGCGRKPQGEAAQPPEARHQAARVQEAEIVLDVYVPCAFAKAMEQISNWFEQENPQVRIAQRVENVSVLTQRIRDGAKPDAFLCVGDHEIDLLDQEGLIEYRRDFCFTSLMLLTPRANPAGVKTLADLAKPEVQTIAIGTSDRSVGYYAEQILKRQGLWEKIQGKLVRPKFPVAILKMLSEGRVQAGIAYAACYRAEEMEKKKMAAHMLMIEDFEDKYCQTIPCAAAVIKGAKHPEMGRRLIEFLLTDRCQDLLAKAGFKKLSAIKCYSTGEEEAEQPPIQQGDGKVQRPSATTRIGGTLCGR